MAAKLKEINAYSNVEVVAEVPPTATAILHAFVSFKEVDRISALGNEMTIPVFTLNVSGGIGFFYSGLVGK